VCQTLAIGSALRLHALQLVIDRGINPIVNGALARLTTGHGMVSRYLPECIAERTSRSKCVRQAHSLRFPGRRLAHEASTGSQGTPRVGLGPASFNDITAIHLRLCRLST
jgi:hypothetical protein